jgi:endoribonuclease Dicer
VNLLVATSVGEEGLDIQTCCLVVRFDLPETVSSFIQSRGRARMTKSKYVFLLERSSSPTYTMMLYMTKSKYVFLLERSSSPTYTMMLY